MASTNLPAGSVVNAPAVERPEFATRYANLALEDFGAKVLSCSDEWFADAQRMLQASEPVFIVGKFDDNGKWMDGWERSEEHTSELQSRGHLVCRLLLEKKNH